MREERRPLPGIQVTGLGAPVEAELAFEPESMLERGGLQAVGATGRNSDDCEAPRAGG